jgi:hypothetical protein
VPPSRPDLVDAYIELHLCPQKKRPGNIRNKGEIFGEVLFVNISFDFGRKIGRERARVRKRQMGPMAKLMCMKGHN